MSFTRKGVAAGRSVELIRESLLQSDGLPFSDALTTEQIDQAFQEEGIAFGEPGDHDTQGPDDDPGIAYTMGVTLWAMLSQALFTGLSRSCVAAVQRVALYYSLLGVEVSSTNTGAYCRARAKVTEGVVRRLAVGVAQRCEAAIPRSWRWNGFRAILVDGTTFSMPDTQANQEEYPQPDTQAEGVGFPILRAVALISLATGMVFDLEVGPYAGKETGETALFRKMFGHLGKGDLAVTDRYSAGWFMLALLRAQQVEFVTLLHQLRNADFSQGEQLGKGDHIVNWPKPPKPRWLDQATYDRLPDELTIREVQANVAIPGYRTQSLIVVTLLTDSGRFPKSEITHLYRQRWRVELHLRDIKSTMDLDILRRKTPEAVRQELWAGLLTYNLVRQSMLQSAMAGDCQPEQLSFAATLQMLENTWVLAAVPTALTNEACDRLIELRIINGYSHRVGKRPDRYEPRAVKRRPNPIALLTEDRETARARMLTDAAS